MTEEERHSVHVLGSFLDVGSVESVRHTPEGAIEVYRSSENLAGRCPDGDACRAGQSVRQEKERVKARVLRDLRYASINIIIYMLNVDLLMHFCRHSNDELQS